MGFRSYKSSMYQYEANNTVTIDAVNQYHAVQGFLEGCCNGGVTFLASTSGAITDTANSDGTLRCTDAGHGLTTGQYITLTGMGDAAHVGITRVSVVDENTFDCDDILYSSDDDTGNWQRGSSLTIDSGRGGAYRISFSASVKSAGVLKNYNFELCHGTTHLDEFAAESKIATAGDLVTISSSGIHDLVAGDILFLMVKGTTDDTNMTIEHANVHIFRL